MFGNWTIKVNTKGMPQKVATAFNSLSEKLLGAEYEFVAYLGSQLVNGTNHAVLAKQILITGRDTENITLLIFNEKPDDTEATLVSIERVIEGNPGFGGTSIGVQFKEDFTEELLDTWAKAFNGLVGCKVEPIALLATQLAHGVNYTFIADSEPVCPNPEGTIELVTINPEAGTMTRIDLLANKSEMPLGYAFTWLRKNR